MAISKDKKEEIVKKLKTVAAAAKALVFVNFRGLPVAETNHLRRTLRQAGVGYLVAKKTLLKRALSLTEDLPGEIAVAYPTAGETEEQLLAPAKEIHAFSKRLGESARLEIVGGRWAGEYRAADFMKELAIIPDKQVLISKLAWLLNYPIQSLAISLNEVAKHGGKN